MPQTSPGAPCPPKPGDFVKKALLPKLPARIGDTVHVRCLITHVSDGPEPKMVRVTMGNDWCWVGTDAIVKIEPRPLQPGDKVRAPNFKVVGAVLAIDGGDAWVRWVDGERSTFAINELERIP